MPARRGFNAVSADLSTSNIIHGGRTRECTKKSPHRGVPNPQFVPVASDSPKRNPGPTHLQRVLREIFRNEFDRFTPEECLAQAQARADWKLPGSKGSQTFFKALEYAEKAGYLKKCEDGTLTLTPYGLSRREQLIPAYESLCQKHGILEGQGSRVYDINQEDSDEDSDGNSDEELMSYKRKINNFQKEAAELFDHTCPVPHAWSPRKQGIYALEQHEKEVARFNASSIVNPTFQGGTPPRQTAGLRPDATQLLTPPDTAPRRANPLHGSGTGLYTPPASPSSAPVLSRARSIPGAYEIDDDLTDGDDFGAGASTDGAYVFSDDQPVQVKCSVCAIKDEHIAALQLERDGLARQQDATAAELLALKTQDTAQRTVIANMVEKQCHLIHQNEMANGQRQTLVDQLRANIQLLAEKDVETAALVEELTLRVHASVAAHREQSTAQAETIRQLVEREIHILHELNMEKKRNAEQASILAALKVQLLQAGLRYAGALAAMVGLRNEGERLVQKLEATRQEKKEVEDKLQPLQRFAAMIKDNMPAF